jgi:hypothetical protein
MLMYFAKHCTNTCYLFRAKKKKKSNDDKGNGIGIGIGNANANGNEELLNVFSEKAIKKWALRLFKKNMDHLNI